MRDISELIKREKPAGKLTDEEIARKLAEEDQRMIRDFTPRRRVVKQSIGKRPWT